MTRAVDAELTLTVNRRFARALVHEHALRQHEQGSRVWHSPDILPYEAWLRRCHGVLCQEAAEPPPVALDAFQERLLWERVVAEDSQAEAGREALQPGFAAQLAQAAHALLLRYRVADAQWAASDMPEATLLRRWIAVVRGKLAGGGWMAPAALGSVVTDALEQGLLPVPRRLTMAGFDQLTPEQARLVQVLSRHGSEVMHDEPPAERAVPALLVPATPRDELLQAAGWARDVLARGEAESVGVLVPDLARRREEVWDAFEDVLHPSWFDEEPDTARLFELSMGESLARQPVVRTALAILAAASGSLGLEESSELLMSPYLRAAGEENSARAKVDAWLRSRGEKVIGTRRLVQLARNARVAGPRGGAARFAERLDALCRDIAPRRRHLPSEWLRRSGHWLELMGWPGQEALDSRHFQLVQAMRECIENLAALDALLGRIPLAALRVALHGMLEERIHQHASEGAARVQIFGGLEAIGVRVDALWITGMHDGAWPGIVECNPLLPIAMQKQHGMPGADPAVELARARAITARWLSCAPRIRVSHPRYLADQALRTSRLMSTAVAEQAPQPAGVQPEQLAPARLMARQAVALQLESDERLPPLPAGHLARGGAAVLKDVSACPFQAAARHRLGASTIEQPEHPLDARMRGIAAHRLMQYLWDELGSSSRLASLSGQELDELIRGCVERVLDGLRRELPATVRGGLRRLETLRLEDLSRAWLDIEGRRPRFTVRAAEQRQRLHAGGLEFDVRIDRIDVLADGRLMLIDYKTGRCQISDWSGERPREPQLPLYAAGFLLAGADSGLAAVSYACLRSGELGFRGIGVGQEIPDPLDRPGEKRLKAFESMDELVEGWRQRVDRLAADLREGDARVMPRDGPQTCRYCELAALCRIAENQGPRP